MSALPPKATSNAAYGMSAKDQTDLSNCEHNLAGRSGLKDLLVRARGLGEWQYFANNGPQRAVFEPCKKSSVDVCLFGRCDGPESEGVNRSAARHQLTGIDSNLAATADHDDAAIVGQ